MIADAPKSSTWMGFSTIDQEFWGSLTSGNHQIVSRVQLPPLQPVVPALPRPCALEIIVAGDMHERNGALSGKNHVYIYIYIWYIHIYIYTRIARGITQPWKTHSEKHSVWFYGRRKAVMIPAETGQMNPGRWGDKETQINSMKVLVRQWGSWSMNMFWYIYIYV